MPASEFIYGVNPCFEVLRAGRRHNPELWLHDSYKKNPRLQKLSELAGRLSVPMHVTDKHQLFEMTGAKEHQGVALKVSPYPYVNSDELWGHERLILLDNIEDPHNLGSILRSAEIFGFKHVLLPTKGSPPIYPSVVKASAGACEHLQIARDRSAVSYVKIAQENGFMIIALDAKGKETLNDIRTAGLKKFLLVIGGEDKAIGQYILNTADTVISIPQQGRIGSLNASVAAGIALYTLGR